MTRVSVLTQKVMVINYLPEICLFLFSFSPIFVLQTLVLSSTFSCCYLTPFTYFLQPKTSSYISSSNYGGPWQIPFCSLHVIPSPVIHILQFRNIILSIKNWSFVPFDFLWHPFLSLFCSIFYFTDGHMVHY